MFEITPLPEFSAWFESLSSEQAEEVACSLDLLAEAGIALGPSHVSRTLLWFDGNGGGWNENAMARLFPRPLPGSSPFYRRDSRASLAEVHEFLFWQREVVRCLASTAFRDRLARLEPDAARVALLALENLKLRLKAAGKYIARPHTLPRAARELELKEGFFQLLRLVGLDPLPVMNSLSGLCELNIPPTEPTEPPLRVLFGLDAVGQRVVALLGESLNRNYYGDSVTLAEQRWQQYCAATAVHTSANPSHEP